MAGADWVQAVKPPSAYEWDQGPGEWPFGRVERGDGLHVIALAPSTTFSGISLTAE